MAKRRVTQDEKWTVIRERMAIERPRRSDHLVTVFVDDETDENGDPIVTVVRMRRPEKTSRS